MMTSAQQFIEAARKYLGTRWYHMGRSINGLDCIGLLLQAADDCGIAHPTPPPYARGSRGFDMFEVCQEFGEPVSLKDTQDGDILVFSDGRYPGHMGIRTTVQGLPHVLHARINRRKVCEEPLAHELAQCLRRAYRPYALQGGVL